MLKKPNTVFLLNDHQAYFNHEKLKNGKKIIRPNFEKLAKNGVEFTRASSVCPLCGPARRSMLNGLYPHNHKEIRNDVNVPFDEDTYLDVLASAGYKIITTANGMQAPEQLTTTLAKDTAFLATAILFLLKSILIILKKIIFPAHL